MLLKALAIEDLHIRVAALPYLAAKTKFLVGAKRNASPSQELSRPKESTECGDDLACHEVVNGNFSGAHIGSKNFDK
jgi:N-formylglutamate amidohydrolase